MSPLLCGKELEVQLYPTPPDGGSLSPKRPRHDQRDSGVSAAIGGGTSGKFGGKLKHPKIPSF